MHVIAADLLIYTSRSCRFLDTLSPSAPLAVTDERVISRCERTLVRPALAREKRLERRRRGRHEKNSIPGRMIAL